MWRKSAVVVECLVADAGDRECAEGYTKCEGETAERKCIRTAWLCDGDNDCGNNWDENPAHCGR